MLQQKKIKDFIFLGYFSVVTFLIVLFFVHDSKVALWIAGLEFLIRKAFFLLLGIIKKRFFGYEAKTAVIFLTGLSGSGKTTLAKALMKKLQQKGIMPVLLDGDEIRDVIKQDKFDEESRKRHNINVGYMASLLEAQGNTVIVSLISPYEDTRLAIRGMCKNFIEVYVSTDLQVCIERDTKGLYAKAIRGEIKDFTGISAPYYPPKYPDLQIDTALLSIDESVDKLCEVLQSK